VTVLHAGPTHLASWLPLVPVLLAALGYAAGVVQLRIRGNSWPRRRSLAAGSGLAVLAAALLPPLSGRTETSFVAHVAQHLAISGLAPLLLVLAAPVTLALRTLPARPRAGLLRLLHSPLARWLTSPGIVLLVVVGGLYAFYLTPLFLLAQSQAVVHLAVHLHMLAAGVLLSAYLVGVDPMPGRAGTAARLLVLVGAAAGHDVLAKLLYATGRPLGTGSLVEVRTGAQLMYYGGSAVELLLAVVLLSQWYARSGRELARQRRRALLREA